MDALTSDILDRVVSIEGIKSAKQLVSSLSGGQAQAVMESGSVEPVDGGWRPPTMADIAAHLGVSRQLVSLALRGAPGASEDTQQRVRQAAKDLGYAPHVGARALRRARSTDLGVVFAPAHSFEPGIIEAIYPAASSRGYHVILSAQTPSRGTNQAVEELLGHRCAALIVMGSNLSHTDLREVSERSPVPLVTVGYGKRNPYYDVVRSAGDVGTAKMVGYLAELGHREIAFVDLAMPLSDIRRRGYEKASRLLGLRADVLDMKDDYTETTYLEEAGATAARELLGRKSLPTAIVTSSDHAAVGLLHMLVRNDIRVPEDLSVTGFDDAPIAGLSAVDLTTVRVDPQLTGIAAVEAAIRRIENPDLRPKETAVETSLVVRGSTAPPSTRHARRTAPRHGTARTQTRRL